MNFRSDINHQMISTMHTKKQKQKKRVQLLKGLRRTIELTHAFSSIDKHFPIPNVSFLTLSIIDQVFCIVDSIAFPSVVPALVMCVWLVFSPTFTLLCILNRLPHQSSSLDEEINFGISSVPLFSPLLVFLDGSHVPLYFIHLKFKKFVHMYSSVVTQVVVTMVCWVTIRGRAGSWEFERLNDVTDILYI